MRFVDGSSCGVKAFWFARRHHEKRVPVFSLQSTEGNQREWLLCGDDAARNNDRRTAAPLRLPSEPFGDRRSCGKLQVVLQIAADLHPLSRSAHGANPLRILLTLHQKCRSIRERAPQKRPQKKSKDAKEAPIARKRPVRNTSAHEHDRNTATPCLPQKVRPNLRLQNNHDRGP